LTASWAKAGQALWVLKGKRIGVLGLAFKPETDDIRFATALELIEKLLEEDAEVQVYDPQAMTKTNPLFPSIRYCSDPYQVAEGAEALMIVTEWDEFKHLNWERIRNSMARPLLLDGCNLLNGEEMVKLGFEYLGIGKGTEEVARLIAAR
jgi:UDPglucose 6-dehydrogenase